VREGEDIPSAAPDLAGLGMPDERTVTAGTGQFEGAYYVAPDEYFDGEGAVAIRVLVTQAPSSGTVTFWVGSK
jgi:hypothetical protein